MPTELPLRKLLSTASTAEGTLAFAIAVLLMLAISTAVLLHPISDRSAEDTEAHAQNL